MNGGSRVLKRFSSSWANPAFEGVNTSGLLGYLCRHLAQAVLPVALSDPAYIVDVKVLVLPSSFYASTQATVEQYFILTDRPALNIHKVVGHTGALQMLVR